MAKAAIDAQSAADDVRAGLDDAALMKKYGLSARGLQSLLRKLISAGMLSQRELDTRMSETDTSIVLDLSIPVRSEQSQALARSLAVIVISRDPSLLISVRELLEAEDLQVFGSVDPDSDFFERVHPHVVVADMDPGQSDLQGILSSLRLLKRFVPILAVVDSARQRALQGVPKGIFDLLDKPVDAGLFVFAIRRALTHAELMHSKSSTLQTASYSETVNLLEQVREAQDNAILTLAGLMESREGRGSHLQRIRNYCRILCTRASERESFRDILTAEYIEDFVRASILHDVGKATMSDAALYGTEWTDREVLKQHPVFGGRALEEAANRLGRKSFLSVGMEIAYYHHEHWDGSGYPFGLHDCEIPFAARIFAIADAYEYMTSNSGEKKPLSHTETVGRIVENKGVRFDPELVEIFLDAESEFRHIMENNIK
jgi:putative two-component system response regulator